MQSLLRRSTAFLTPSSSTSALPQKSSGSNFIKAPTTTALFPTVDPQVDGDDCDHDCATCTITYPKKFSIEESDKLYGGIKGWSTHLVVATGKSDWVRDVSDEHGSVMEAVGKAGQQLQNGKVMLSASNMPLPDEDDNEEVVGKGGKATNVLLLPAMTMIENVRPSDVADLLKGYVASAVTTTTPLVKLPPSPPPESNTIDEEIAITNPRITAPSTPPLDPVSATIPPTLPLLPSNLTTQPSPHSAVILLCSQKTRDARCGQSAPLLRREFERHLRPLGLYRDLCDTRPGGVGIYFISHVGGHKYSANVMIYRRRMEADCQGEMIGEDDGSAVQGIWLARVKPEDCEGIIRFTVLKGKVVKPETQLRGGFDRGKGLVSW